MKVSATVPTRIDLAGGTLDIYPLYLFEDGGLTLNAAINVCGHVTVETRSDSRIIIRSQDRGTVEEIESLDSMPLRSSPMVSPRSVAWEGRSSMVTLSVSRPANPSPAPEANGADRRTNKTTATRQLLLIPITLPVGAPRAKRFLDPLCSAYWGQL